MLICLLKLSIWATVEFPDVCKVNLCDFQNRKLSHCWETMWHFVPFTNDIMYKQHKIHIVFTVSVELSAIPVFNLNDLGQTFKVTKTFYYRQDLPEGLLCCYCFYSRADFWPQGWHVAPIKVKFGREERIFSGKKSPFQWREQIWILSLGGATIRAGMPQKIFKIWENGCKVCAHHFDHLQASWQKSSMTAFYPMYYRCAPV